MALASASSTSVRPRAAAPAPRRGQRRYRARARPHAAIDTRASGPVDRGTSRAGGGLGGSPSVRGSREDRSRRTFGRIWATHAHQPLVLRRLVEADHAVETINGRIMSNVGGPRVSRSEWTAAASKRFWRVAGRPGRGGERARATDSWAPSQKCPSRTDGATHFRGIGSAASPDLP